MHTKYKNIICGSAMEKAKGMLSLVVSSGIKSYSINRLMISKYNSLSPKKKDVYSIYVYRPGIDPLRRRSFLYFISFMRIEHIHR
jgi:hypothetical protein